MPPLHCPRPIVATRKGLHVDRHPFAVHCELAREAANPSTPLPLGSRHTLASPPRWCRSPSAAACAPRARLSSSYCTLGGGRGPSTPCPRVCPPSPSHAPPPTVARGSRPPSRGRQHGRAGQVRRQWPPRAPCVPAAALPAGHPAVLPWLARRPPVRRLRAHALSVWGRGASTHPPRPRRLERYSRSHVVVLVVPRPPPRSFPPPFAQAFLHPAAVCSVLPATPPGTLPRRCWVQLALW